MFVLGAVWSRADITSSTVHTNQVFNSDQRDNLVSSTSRGNTNKYDCNEVRQRSSTLTRSFSFSHGKGSRLSEYGIICSCRTPQKLTNGIHDHVISIITRLKPNQAQSAKNLKQVRTFIYPAQASQNGAKRSRLCGGCILHTNQLFNSVLSNI